MDEDHILLAREKGADHTFLPGGHIEPGEGARFSLRREISEELGLRSEVGEYLGAVEAQWRDAAGRHHEINHAFLVQLADLIAGETPVSREEHLEFLWSPVERLADNNLLPDVLVALISRFSKGDHSTWWSSTIEAHGNSSAFE